MGLGKTVQMRKLFSSPSFTSCEYQVSNLFLFLILTVALILSNPFDPDDEDGKTMKTTLIVAPVGLLEQWKLEVENKTKKKLRVEIYHGPKRKTSSSYF